MTFDEIWEKEERQGLQQRLRQDYPTWKRRRRTTLAAAASVAMVFVMGISIFNFQFSTSKGYDEVCCNRSGIPNGHWADVAGRILTIETL